MAYFNITANGQTAAVKSPGTRVHVLLTGTFDSATVVLQFLDDQSTPAWTNITGASWTSATSTVIELAPTQYDLRFSTSGVVTASDIDATLK